MTDEPTRAATYCRVSTEEQSKEGFSLASQTAKLRAYCLARGWEVTGEYVDAGVSGRTPNRPAYQQMLSESDKWDTIVVIKMDRVHRNSRAMMDLMDWLDKHGKDFASLSESLDSSTAMGRFVCDIIARIAQLESEQIGERVSWGMSQKADEGSGTLGFKAPLGYDWDDGELLVNPHERPIVQRIFTEFRQGRTAHAIATSLQADGIPTKKGGKWARQTISKMLSNPIYCGYLHWDGRVYRGEHEPIVPVSEYNEAQRLKRGGGLQVACLVS